MVQVDLPGAFAAGQLCAMLSKPYLKAEPRPFCHRLMGPITLYMTIMFSPVGLFLLVCWPAWEGMYWWEWVERPAANPPVSFFYIGFFLAMVIIGLSSYMLAHKLYRLGKDKIVLALAVIGVVCALLPFFLWPFTWYWVGNFADYHADPRQSTVMFDTPAFFHSWAIVIGYFAVSSTAFGIWLKKNATALIDRAYK
jgi:hypothetical protein